MKRNIKILNVTICLALISVTVVAQQEKNENKDFVIIESALNQLFYGEFAKEFRGAYSTRHVSINRIQGFGLIINVPRIEKYYYPGEVNNPLISERVNKGNSTKTGLNVFSENEVELQVKKDQEAFKEKVLTFLIDYGSLIESLSAKDRIVIFSGSNEEKDRVMQVKNPMMSRTLYENKIEPILSYKQIVATVSFATIQKFSGGQQGESALRNDVSFKYVDESDLNKVEFDIVADILGKIHQPKVLAFDNQHKTEYQVIGGLGAIYTLDFRNPILKGSRFGSGTYVEQDPVIVGSAYVLPGKASGSSIIVDRDSSEGQGASQIIQSFANENNVAIYSDSVSSAPILFSLEGYRKKWKKEYEALKTALQTDIIKYGKTLKSLDTDEYLILKVNLSRCYGCDVPNQLTLSIRSEVLANYRAGKISLDNALGKISIHEQYPQ